MAGSSPNPKYVHIYVIGRVDEWLSKYDEPPERMISLTKAYWTAEAAEAEVQRLNDLQKGKECHYFYQLARLHHNKTP